MRIIFQFKLLCGENKIHWNNEGVYIPSNILIRHMLAMRLQFLLIYFFLNG